MCYFGSLNGRRKVPSNSTYFEKKFHKLATWGTIINNAHFSNLGCNILLLILKLSLPACLRACTTNLCVYHIAGGPSSVDGVARPVQFHLTRGNIRVTSTRHRYPARTACRARSTRGDTARYIAGKHSERSPLLYL